MASTRVAADFRIVIRGTVAAAIAALLVPALAADAPNFLHLRPLRRSPSDPTACPEKKRRSLSGTRRRRSLLKPGRKPRTQTRIEHSYVIANRTEPIVTATQGGN